MPENDQPASKQDLADLRAHVDRLRDDLIEAMRDMQTEVLRAFHNWARPTDIKLRSHEDRIALIEERLAAIERGDFRPPDQKQ